MTFAYLDFKSVYLTTGSQKLMFNLLLPAVKQVRN